MKVAKPVVILDHWIGRKSCCMDEHKRSCDKEIKPYIRSKRQHNLLPDSWNTKWINVRQFRNWKHRCKKRHQWEKHIQKPEEIELVTGSYPEKYLMYLYGRLDRWVEIDVRHMSQVENMINKGILDGGYSKRRRYSTELDDDGDSIYTHTYYISYLKYARKKQ